MNIINQTLILVIIIFLINHLLDGKLMDNIYAFIDCSKKNIENFYSVTYKNNKGVISSAPNGPFHNQLDFNYLAHTEQNDASNNLYRFLNSVVTPNVNNYSMTASNNKKINDNNMKKEIINNISRLFNRDKYLFYNIKILDNIFYYDNTRGKDLVPFSFFADVKYRDKYIGRIKIYMEAYFKREYKTFVILNIRLQDLEFAIPTKNNITSSIFDASNVDPPGIYKINPKEIEAIEETKKLADKMDDSFNNFFVKRDNNELFIEGNHTEDSMIPSYVNLNE